jgi:hypothetical protein
MVNLRPVRPEDTRRLLTSAVRRLDALTLENFTPAWIRPRGAR